MQRFGAISTEDKRLKESNSPAKISSDKDKAKQKALDNFTLFEKNTVFVDKQVQELIAKNYKNSDVSNTHRKL